MFFEFQFGCFGIECQPKSHPRGTMMPPNSTQDALKILPKVAKKLPRGIKNPQESPKRLPRGSKEPPRRALNPDGHLSISMTLCLHHAGQESPGRSQERPKGEKEAQRLPKGCFWVSRGGSKLNLFLTLDLPGCRRGSQGTPRPQKS